MTREYDARRRRDSLTNLIVLGIISLFYAVLLSLGSYAAFLGGWVAVVLAVAIGISMHPVVGRYLKPSRRG